MLKNEKGITMAMLIVTVVVMVIIATIAVSTGNNLVKKSELADRVSQMQLIQAKAEEIYNEHLYSNTKLLGEEVLIDSDNNSATPEEKWYKLSKEDLEKMGIDFKPTDELYYCVKYDLTQEKNKDGVDKGETEEIDVYYSGGYKSTNKNTYYTLNKLKDLES